MTEKCLSVRRSDICKKLTIETVREMRRVGVTGAGSVSADPQQKGSHMAAFLLLLAMKLGCAY